MMRCFLVYVMISFLLSCSGQESKEPVAGDPAFSGIDPDQKALPKDGAPAVEQPAKEPAVSEASAEAPPTSPETSAAESAVAPPPPTPPVEELAGAEAKENTEVPKPEVGESSSQESTIAGSGPQVRYVKAFEINIRSKPNRYSTIVGRLRGGDEVRVSIHGGWSKLDDGRWIRTRWLVKSPPEKLSNTPPDEEGRPQKNRKSRLNKKSKRPSRGSKS